jgi:NADH-quinone oxidoreductase subunit C
MDSPAICQLVAERLPRAQIRVEPPAPSDAKDGPRDPALHLSASDLIAIATLLRDDEALAFDFLQNLTAVDWPKRDEIEVVYHLWSYRHRHALVLKLRVPRNAPEVPSLAQLWRSAEWNEREQFDLLGVVFVGHPDLRRILMPEDWPGHPMRKDYVEAASYRGMPTSRPNPLELLPMADRAHPKPSA